MIDDRHLTLSDICAQFERADMRSLLEHLAALYGGRATDIGVSSSHNVLESDGFWSLREEYLTQQRPLYIKGESSPEGESVTPKEWRRRREAPTVTVEESQEPVPW